MIKAFTFHILITFGLSSTENVTALDSTGNLSSYHPLHPPNLTNSTIHIGSVVFHDTATSNMTSNSTSPVIHRYMITLTEPQILICLAIAGLGVLIFLFIIISLIIFSYSHQQSQRNLLSQLSHIATELEGITSKASLLNTTPPELPIRRRRPVSFAALPLFTTKKLKQRHSCNHLKDTLSKSMATILEV